mgnify:FL=1
MTRVQELASSEAINTLAPDVARALEALIAAHLGDTFPALAITAIHRGRVLVNQSWGWIDPVTREYPIGPDALFDLASVSKLFTTTAFLSLVSEERAALDDPLVAIVPEFGESGLRPLDGGQDPHSKVRLPTPPELLGKTADPSKVTLRMLLTHTSGLAPWRDVFNAAGPPPSSPDEVDPLPRAERWANALRALCAYPFVGQPGEGVVRYSDLGLMLLGEAVARLDGSGDLAVAVRRRVTEPLALPSVTYNPLQHGRARAAIVPTEDDPAWRGRRCWGEVHDENACGVGGVAGHAGLFGVARDIAALGQAWLGGDPRLAIAPGLRADAVRERAETDGTRRGLGWMLKAREGSSIGEQFHPDAYGHFGFTGTSLWIDPARELVVAALTNRVYPGREHPGIEDFRRGLHDLLAKAVDEV